MTSQYYNNEWVAGSRNKTFSLQNLKNTLIGKLLSTPVTFISDECFAASLAQCPFLRSCDLVLEPC